MPAPRVRALLTIGGSALLLLTGCHGHGLRPLDTALAESEIDLLRTHHFHQLQDDMTLDLRIDDTPDVLASLSRQFPAARPISVKVVGANTLTQGGVRSTDVTLEYHFPGKWLLADVATQESPRAWTLTALHVTAIPDSLEHTNHFSIWGRTELEYDTLALALLSLLFSAYAFVACLTSRIRTGKWLWLLLTLTGVGGFDVNWTTGDYVLTPWVLRLPTAGGSAPIYGPATIYVALPLGALVFLVLRRRLTERKSAALHELPDYEQPPLGQPLLWHRTAKSITARRPGP